MKISSSHVGPLPGRREITLTTRQMLAYAAGIGDGSPFVFDDLHPDFMAHPALCVALEWPVISDPGGLARIVSDPRALVRAVQSVQDSTFHRPMRSGDQLTTSGRITGIWRGATGVRVASELCTRNSLGEEVVTSQLLAIYRGVQAEGEDQPAAQPATVPAADPACGETQSAPLPIERALPHRYSECSGIWNPIHTERRAARAAGLPDVVLHGTATWALAGSELIRRLADGKPGRLKRLHGRFAALVFPGTTLRLQYRTRERDRRTEVFFEVLTPEGERAISDGFALLA